MQNLSIALPKGMASPKYALQKTMSARPSMKLPIGALLAPSVANWTILAIGTPPMVELLSNNICFSSTKFSRKPTSGLLVWRLGWILRSVAII